MTAFEYEVRAVFEVPEADLDYLVRLSGLHYDPTCKSAGRPGFGGFLNGLKNSAEDGVARGRLKSRELGIACKILELPELPGSGDAHRRLCVLFYGLLRSVIDEDGRVNGPAKGGADDGSLAALEAAAVEAAREDLDDAESFAAGEAFQGLATPDVVLKLVRGARSR